MIAKVSHIRAAKICLKGARQWFNRHGIPWQDFLANGVPVETLEATGDPMAFRVTAIARKEAENGR